MENWKVMHFSMFDQWRADYNHPLIVSSAIARKNLKIQTPINDKEKDNFWELMKGLEKEKNQPCSNKVGSFKNYLVEEKEERKSTEKNQIRLVNPFTSDNDDVLSQRSQRQSVNVQSTVVM